MKRLSKQFDLVNKMDEENVVCKQKDNLFHWEVIIKGPVGSPYEGGQLEIDFDFPEQFPFKFPVVRFKTPIWHPNVKDGDICQEMLGQKQWLPNKKVSQIVHSIQSMLLHPEIGVAINLQAANEFKEGKFADHAKEIMQKASENK